MPTAAVWVINSLRVAIHFHLLPGQMQVFETTMRRVASSPRLGEPGGDQPRPRRPAGAGADDIMLKGINGLCPELQGPLHVRPILFWPCSAARTGPSDRQWPLWRTDSVLPHAGGAAARSAEEFTRVWRMQDSACVRRFGRCLAPGFSRFGYGAHDVVKNHNSHISHLYPGTHTHLTSHRSSFRCHVR